MKDRQLWKALAHKFIASNIMFMTAPSQWPMLHKIVSNRTTKQRKESEFVFRGVTITLWHVPESHLVTCPHDKGWKWLVQLWRTIGDWCQVRHAFLSFAKVENTLLKCYQPMKAYSVFQLRENITKSINHNINITSKHFHIKTWWTFSKSFTACHFNKISRSSFTKNQLSRNQSKTPYKRRYQ